MTAVNITAAPTTAAAVEQARREGWGSENCTPDMSPGQRAARAVLDDMAYCRRWLTGDLFYVGVCVQALGADGDPIGDENSLWGVEYGYGRDASAYAKETAAELVAELDYVRNKEAAEVAYWVARDVLTAGTHPAPYL